jgi:hypothetical protein
MPTRRCEGDVQRELWLTRARIAAAAALVATSACGSSGHVGAATPLALDASSDSSVQLALGALCGSDRECSSGFCLLLTPNPQGVTGFCSKACADSADCTAAGVCVKETSADGGPSGLAGGGACYHACNAASDCTGGLPCLWQKPLDAGVCQPLSDRFCQNIVATGSACEACLAGTDTDAGPHCCDAIIACVEDVPCAKLETCSGTCASSLPGSGNAAAQALASCAAAKCASVCQ